MKQFVNEQKNLLPGQSLDPISNLSRQLNYGFGKTNPLMSMLFLGSHMFIIDHQLENKTYFGEKLIAVVKSTKLIVNLLG